MIHTTRSVLFGLAPRCTQSGFVIANKWVMVR
jgi:hypothetical protein